MSCPPNIYLYLNIYWNFTRYTVGKITPIQRREVRASDFGTRASFWMNFPKEGSQLTPRHQSEDFKWKDYCPMVFRLVAKYTDRDLLEVFARFSPSIYCDTQYHFFCYFI